MLIQIAHFKVASKVDVIHQQFVHIIHIIQKVLILNIDSSMLKRIVQNVQLVSNSLNYKI